MSPLVLGEVLVVFFSQNDCQWQVSCSRLREFGTPNSNAIISKTKHFSQFLDPFLKSTSNFEHFEKKDDCHS